MSNIVSDANENLLRVNISRFFTELEKMIQDALFTYYNENLNEGQLNLILAPIHEKHKEYYNILYRHKLNEFRRSARMGALMVYNAKHHFALKAESVNFNAQPNNLFGTLEYSENKLAQDTFKASDFTLSRVDENINQILTDGYKSGAGINEVSRSLTDRFDQLRTWEANRIARTEIHNAQNMGVLSTYESLGVEYTQWMAASDDRTRDSHVELDGEIIPMGGTYSNGLSYPGDTSGPIEEWINCRCSNAPFVMPQGMMAPQGMDQFRESDLVPIEENNTEDSGSESFEGLNEYALSPEDQARLEELQNSDKVGFLQKKQLQELEERARFNELHNQFIKEGKLVSQSDYESVQLQKEYLKLQSKFKDKLNIEKIVDEYKIAGETKPVAKPKINKETVSSNVDEVKIPYAPKTTTINGKKYTNFTDDVLEIERKQLRQQKKLGYSKRDTDVIHNWGFEGHLDISAVLFKVPELKTGMKTDAQIHKDIQDLENAINKGKGFEEPTTIFRGGEVPKGLKEGDIFTVEGFQSYSFDEQIARDFKEENDERFLITSHGDKGTKGVFIDEDMFRALSEDEWLTQKGQKHRVIKVDYEKKILETEFINEW